MKKRYKIIKRYQKAPRISHWDQTKSCNANLIKLIEKIKSEKLPEELKKQMLNTNN